MLAALLSSLWPSGPLIVVAAAVAVLAGLRVWRPRLRPTQWAFCAATAEKGPEYWGEDGFWDAVTYKGLPVPPSNSADEASSPGQPTEEPQGTPWRGGGRGSRSPGGATSSGASNARQPFQLGSLPPKMLQKGSYSSNEVALRRLPDYTTAEQLQEWLGQAGARVVKVELLPDIFNTPSGFALVTLATPKDVDAVLALHRTFFMGSERPVEIGSADSPLMEMARKVRALTPVFTPDDLSRLIILTGLPTDVTRQQIADFLARVGAVADKTHIMPERSGFKGRAVVFLQDPAMQAPVLRLSGEEIYDNGRWVTVDPPTTRAAKECLAEFRGLEGFAMPGSDQRVVVTGLPPNATESQVIEFLTQKGIAVSDAKVVYHLRGRHSGRAVVTPATPEAREQALAASGEYFLTSGRWVRVVAYTSPENLSFMKALRDEGKPKGKPGWTPMPETAKSYVVGLGGRVVGSMTMGGKVDPAGRLEMSVMGVPTAPANGTSPESWSPAQRPSGGTRTLYFANLAWEVDEQVLWNAVEEVTGEGSVTQVRLVNDKDTGRFQGYGFVTFRRMHDADEALEKLQGRGLYGRPVRIDYHTTIEKRPSPISRVIPPMAET